MLSGGDVSAVVTSYNAAGWIRDALDGIAAQTVRPREVIVTDDGSTDGTAAVVEAFGREHPELAVRFLTGPTNQGNPPTRNRGIEAATGSWIAVCDDDDVWLPARLERQLERVAAWTSERPLVAVATWGVNVNQRLQRISPAHMGPVTEASYDRVMAWDGLFYCLHSSLLLRRDDVLAVGGYRGDYDSVEDLDLLARLGPRGVITCVDEELVLYRKRLGSIQASRFREQEQAFDRLKVNQARQRSGLPPLDEAEHLAARAAEPWRRRWRRELRSFAHGRYRRGSVLAVNGHRARGVANLAIAAVLDPKRVRAAVGRRGT